MGFEPPLIYLPTLGRQLNKSAFEDGTAAPLSTWPSRLVSNEVDMA
jgi:hypothetical protein